MPRRYALLIMIVAIAGGARADAPAGAPVRGTPAATSLSWQAHASPFRLDIVRGAKVVTQLGGPGAPVAYVLQDGQRHALGRLVSTRKTARGATFEVSTDEPLRRASVRIRTATNGLRIEVSVPGATTIGLALAASPAHHFLGTGTRADSVDMRRQIVPLKVWNECGSSQPAPFFAGSGGFGAYIDSAAVGRIAFPLAVDDARFSCFLGSPPCPVGSPVRAVRICLKASSAAVELLAGSVQRQVTAYAKRVGLPRKPWLPQLSLIQWRDRLTGPAELLADIDEMRRRNLPIGWALLDNPWEDGASGGRCYGSLRPDPDIYPDFRKIVDAVHGRNVRMMLWVSPQINRSGCPAPSLPDGWLTGDDETFLWDLTFPAARAAFVERLRTLVTSGVDGFKVDRGDEINLEPSRLEGGAGTLLQNAYPRLLAQAVVDATASRGRAFGTLLRAGGPGASARVGGFWGGDREHDFDGLQDSIRQAQTAGVAGMPVWGSDIGGYTGGELTADLFIRWAQFGALTPIFEVGGAGANAAFWRFGEPTVELFRRAATLHYELVPLLFQLAQRASRDGLPVVRPLGLTWPHDTRAWSHDLEFTVGDALLAAPVTTASSGDPFARAAAKSRVYLPPGSWIDIFRGTTVVGPRTVTRSSTLAEFPVYLRRGTAVPFNAREPGIWEEPWRPDDLLRGDRQGWLVAPRLGAAATAVDRSSRLAASVSASGSVEIEIADPRREQQILVVGLERVCRVTAGTTPVRHEDSPAGLRTVATGWAVETSGRRAIVVKAVAGETKLSLRLDPCRRPARSG